MLDARVATILAQIACHENGLPQGAPCSPVISNLIGHILDIRLCKLAYANGCTYSRYADDITFSTNKPDFPSCIARRAANEEHEWEVGDKLEEAVVSARFVINPVKTRMQYRSSRQDVTGLVVNRKVNTRTEYRRIVRAMAFRLFKTGNFQRLRMLPDPKGGLTPTMVDGTMAQLHGMFGHIDFVDCKNCEIEETVQPRKLAETALRSKQKLYRRFLMFKDFYSAAAPVVVCEGKTDNIYLLHAIRGLVASYPKLATITANSKVALKIRILKTVKTSAGRVLRLGEGSSSLKAFITDYHKEIGRFEAAGMQYAVVLVVDNDSGAEDICNTIRGLTKKSPSRTDPFTYIAGNLYVVFTPLKEGANKSEIEDCFADTIKNLNLGGKTFNPDGRADSSRYFGKHILSQYVRDNATKIDFSGFSILLDRITAAIEAHQSKQAAVPAVQATP